jgi:LysM repeat protein
MFKVYQIKNGDTIDSVVKNTSSSKEEIEKLNGLMGNYVLVPGEFLVVPNMVETSDFYKYTVRKGDNIYEIAQKYNIDLEQLLKLNGLNKNDYIYPGEEIMVPSVNTGFYITSDSDTLEDIFKKLGDNAHEVLKNNLGIYVKPDQLIVYNR